MTGKRLKAKGKKRSVSRDTSRLSLAPLSFEDAVSTMLQIKKPRAGLTKMSGGKRLK